ncbi:hypothetical protein GGF46_000344 [Coemansia sp. RSA 552]|nr:hypothetical protein GGF46_000344 [Coemansia sp. RSA 552]
MQVISYSLVLAAASTLVDGNPTIARRQMYEGMPGMGSPFGAYEGQGLVPGSGFPQVGMSAYGYGLPELGLSQFVNHDANILAGAGEGEISGHDLKNMDKNMYGYDKYKADGEEKKPDPAYPGCFHGEECDEGGRSGNGHHHCYHDSAAPAGYTTRYAVVMAVAVAALV